MPNPLNPIHSSACHLANSATHRHPKRTGTKGTRHHQSSMVRRERSHRLMRHFSWRRCAHFAVPYTRHPKPGRDSHSACSRRRCMSNLRSIFSNAIYSPRTIRGCCLGIFVPKYAAQSLPDATSAELQVASQVAATIVWTL